MPTTIRVERSGPRADVVLARPDVRNAFDEVVVRELSEAFEALGEDAAVRVVVLRGDGPVFCAGADLEWMRRMAAAAEKGTSLFGSDPNTEDAEAMAGMFRAVASCPKVVIARVQGAALGGGTGLVAAADAAVAAEDAKFGFTEVKLGIVPSVISDHVLRRIGFGHARTLFTSGERFSAAEAWRIGLVAEAVPPGELDAAVDRRVAEALTSGPEAVAAVKRLLQQREWIDGEVNERPTPEEWDSHAASFIAELRCTPEAQEGMRAFLEKRKPGWCPP
jgi:methylglutaconyl-CoA hydratase